MSQADHQPPLTIGAILKRRWETGEFGNTHFRLPAADFDKIKASTPKPSEPRPDWAPESAMQKLMGIPIVIDDSLPPNSWKLVNTQDPSEVLAEGTVDEHLQETARLKNLEPCQACGEPFDPTAHRELCPHCKTKNSCCF